MMAVIKTSEQVLVCMSCLLYTSLEVSSNGETIPMVFLVASGLPFTLLIGCDILRKYAAIIDMDKDTVLLKTDEVEWTAALIENRKAPPEHVIYYIREGHDQRKKVSINREVRNNPEDILWMEKINEIRTFQTDNIDHVLTNEQREKLIQIYNRYRHVFSDTPGKIKNFRCELKFKDQTEFKRKSYPIAFSLKEAVRQEIQRLIENDIIEISNSPYTNPIVAVPKKNGAVRICLDAREINKAIINDRTSPGEIDEILKKFYGTRYISIWDTVCGYWQVELHPCLLYTSRCV